MKRKYKLLTGIALVGVVLDQLSKFWARGLEDAPPITVIEHYFDLIYVENKGAAWGLFSGISDSIRAPFFILISLLAIGFIFYFLRKVRKNQTVLILALSFVLGGAVGNFIDRLVYNSVIDFIDWHYYQHHWPTFNVADIFISVGVGFLLIEMFFGKSELSIFQGGTPDGGETPAKEK